MKNFWKNKKVVVTGGTGFIGSHIVEQLKTQKAHVKLSKGDLRDYSVTSRNMKGAHIVLHLASRVAGIQYNIGHPVEMFNNNVIMTQNVLEACKKNQVERVLIMSSACVYRRNAPLPTKESEGFVDDPEETNLGYGWSKRVMELMARFYHQEYGMKIAVARPYNTYGPRDNFDPAYSHVIPGMIKRLFDGENPLKIWGSGRQTRSFIYVDDCVRGILQLIEKYPVPDPINIGSSSEISIANLAKLIVNLSGFDVTIRFDRSKPDGQPRRLCDIKKAKKLLGFKAEISLEEGLLKTIEWYKKQHSSSSRAMKSLGSRR